MSLHNDFREYADTAIEQGRQVLVRAQDQLGEVAGQATGLVDRTIADLRAQAEKVVSADALRAAVEPYLAQADGYRHSVTDRAGEWLSTARKDPRFAKAYDTAEAVTGRVVETVQLRVVKPIQAFAGRGGAAAPVRTPAARKPATTRPATAKAPAQPATKATATKATAAKPTATKSTAAKSTAAKKAPAKAASTGAKSASAKRTTPRKPSTD